MGRGELPGGADPGEREQGRKVGRRGVHCAGAIDESGLGLPETEQAQHAQGRASHRREEPERWER